MNCPSCSAAMGLDARFCGACGHRLEITPPPGQAATIPALNYDSPVSRDPFVGMNLNGRFTVGEKLGEGGFGAVYRGTQTATGRKVALKVLHPDMTRDPNVLARFRREGQVLCSLRDAHTITTYDFDQTSEGTLFLAMELLEGQSLQDVMKTQSPMAWRRVLNILKRITSSLEEAHGKGIVHRDLKPDNIFLELRSGESDYVKVLDFGIAKLMAGGLGAGGGQGTPQLTVTGQTLGTLEYMSPEQLMGRELDGRSDVYALGVLCYEMMTSRLPFPDAVGPAALISAQLKEEPLPPSQAAPQAGIPGAVDLLILKMLSKKRADRHGDVVALRQDVIGCLAGEAPAVAPNAVSSAAKKTSRPDSTARVERTPAASTMTLLAASKGDAWKWLAVGIVVLGGVIGALFALK